MSAGAERVDVLAVMGSLNLADPGQRPELTRARDAVRELIEAARLVLSNATYADGVMTACTLDAEVLERALSRVEPQP